MLTPPPHVHAAQCVDGSIAILNLQTENWQMLDAFQSRVWNALVLRGGVEGLADELAAASGADRVSIRDGVRTTLDNLIALGLIAEPRIRNRRRWRISR